MATKTYYVCDFCGAQSKDRDVIVGLTLTLDKESTQYYEADVCPLCLGNFLLKYVKSMSYERAQKFVLDFFPAKKVVE